mgnify:CR=1 FL=1|jgi:hypothetical protein
MTKVVKKDLPQPLCITKQILALKIGECLEYRGERAYAHTAADVQNAKKPAMSEKPARSFKIRSAKDPKNPGYVDIFCVKA